MAIDPQLTRRLNALEAQIAELKSLLTSRPKRHYNLKEAAEMCGISQSTVRNLIGRGVVESVIIGGRKTIEEDDLIKIQTMYQN